MTIDAIRNVVEAAIQRASQATGVDFAFLMKTAGRESGFNPRARASTSSAAGLFQFVEQTWLSTLKQHGAKHGYAGYADLISRGADGRYRVNSDARRSVMDLRLDPQAASVMAGELATDHAAYIRGRVGRVPTSGELYAAHFLGPEGSARLIELAQRNPDAAAASMFPEAAQANRSIFYREGRPATVAEVYDNLTRTVGGDAPAPVRGGEPAFVRYANHEARAQELALVGLILRGSQTADREGASPGARLTGSLFTTEMLKMLSAARDG